MHNDSDREVMNTTSSNVRVMEKRTTRPNRRPFIGLITLLLPCFLDTVASESQSSTSWGDQVVISQVHRRGDCKRKLSPEFRGWSDNG